MLAIRKNHYIISAKDFDKAYRYVVKKNVNEFEFYN